MSGDGVRERFEQQTVGKHGLKLVIFVRDAFVCIDSRRVAERAVREGAVAVNGVSAVGDQLFFAPPTYILVL